MKIIEERNKRNTKSVKLEEHNIKSYIVFHQKPWVKIINVWKGQRQQVFHNVVSVVELEGNNLL